MGVQTPIFGSNAEVLSLLKPSPTYPQLWRFGNPNAALAPGQKRTFAMDGKECSDV